MNPRPEPSLLYPPSRQGDDFDVFGSVRVADPYLPNPYSEQHYSVPIHRLIGAVYLGIVTWDANLLILEPGPPRRT